ncbi:MAG TPA: RNA polymerase sigma factor [Steroidobacteraceae bacterium]|nr:RNA polymerase sigma factor [Steroidobacteraceae bacterium]
MRTNKPARPGRGFGGIDGTRSPERGADDRPRSPVTAAFLECSAFLKKFLARLLPIQQDIEDVAQEAYLRAYVAEQRESIEQPKAFLFRVAKNLALTRLSRKSQQITDYIEEAGASVDVGTAAAMDLELEAQQCFGIYCEAVASLPEKCRQVFLLRKVHGLSHKEIGERMELSVSSVEKYLQQGILTCQVYVRDREGLALAKSQPTQARSARSRGKVGA